MVFSPCDRCESILESMTYSAVSVVREAERGPRKRKEKPRVIETKRREREREKRYGIGSSTQRTLDTNCEDATNGFVCYRIVRGTLQSQIEGEKWETRPMD